MHLFRGLARGSGSGSGSAPSSPARAPAPARPNQTSIDGSGASGSSRRGGGGGMQLVRYGERHSGAHGADAPAALAGAPGAAMTVTLTSVGGAEGGALQYMAHVDSQYPFGGGGGGGAGVVSVPFANDLVVRARGGDGEPGGVGEDGRAGYPGSDGANATRWSNATDGTNGGPGGDGGHGTNGGNGGTGGDVVIRVDEHDMHLVFATSWNVAGGDGGVAGRHGKGGKGGRGGSGGRSYSWQEQDGYRLVCNGSCASSSVIQSSSRSGDFFIADGAFNLDGTVHRLKNVSGHLPANYTKALTGAIAESGGSTALTRYSGGGGGGGGGGGCSGCAKVPKYVTRTRPAGSDGRSGNKGRTPSSALYSGSPGAAGNAQIAVSFDDGTEQEYYSKFRLELLDFDLADENDDGIFEPEECVIISNIRIRNAGGMPTPKHTQIPLRMRPVDGLFAVPNEDTVFLPTFIPPGHTYAVNGSLKAKVLGPSGDLAMGEVFKRENKISLVATMPQFNRELEHFGLEKTITAQYPLQLDTDTFDHLDAVPLNSIHTMSWPIRNNSTRGLGSQSSNRRITTRLSTSPVAGAGFGALQPPGAERVVDSTIELGTVLPRAMNSSSQDIQVHQDARTNSSIVLSLDFAITRPFSANGDMVTFQRHQIAIQASDNYSFRPDSKFLILTNTSVGANVRDAWVSFMQSSTRSNVDIWSLSLHGSLTTSIAGAQISPMAKYENKAIIGVRTPFTFHRKSRDMFDFVDPVKAAAIANDNQTALFCLGGTPLSNKETAWLTAVSYSPHLGLANPLQPIIFPQNISQSPNDFMAFVKSKSSLTHTQLSPSAYLVRVRKRRLRKSKSTVDSRAKKLAKRLRHRLPMDNFAVVPAIVDETPDEEGYAGSVYVFHCMPKTTNIRLVQTVLSGGPNFSSPSAAVDEPDKNLSPFEKFVCIAAMPISERLDIMMSPLDYQNLEESQELKDLSRLSILADVQRQVNILTSQSRWSHGIFSKKQIQRQPLIGPRRGVIDEVLRHPQIISHIASPSDPLYNKASDMVRALILSARCQSVKQLFMRYLVPFKRTRSLVRKSQEKMVEEYIAEHSHGTPKEVKRNLKLIMANSRQRMRASDMHETTVFSQIGQLTGYTAGSVKKLLYTADATALFKSKALSKDEWSRVANHYQDWLARSQADSDAHMATVVKSGLRAMNPPVELGMP